VWPLRIQALASNINDKRRFAKVTPVVSSKKDERDKKRKSFKKSSRTRPESDDPVSRPQLPLPPLPAPKKVPKASKKTQKKVKVGEFDHITPRLVDPFEISEDEPLIVEGRLIDPYVPLPDDVDIVISSVRLSDTVVREKVIHYSTGEYPVETDYLIVETPEEQVRYPIDEMDDISVNLLETVEDVGFTPIVPVLQVIETYVVEDIVDQETGEEFKSVPFLKIQKPRPTVFNVDDLEQQPASKKVNKIDASLANISEADYAKRVSDAAKTTKGIARKKKQAERQRHAQAAQQSEMKRENVKFTRNKKMNMLNNWMDGLLDLPDYYGDEVPKDKHQKKTRARKASNVSESPRAYTAEAVRAFRKEQSDKREEKKKKKEVRRAVTESYNVFSDILEKHIGSKTLGWLEWIINFIDVIRSICRFKDFDMRRALLTQWIQQQGFRLIESTIMSSIMAKIITEAPHVPHFKESTNRAVAQSLSEQLDNVGDVLEYVFDSSFADAIKNFFVSCASMHFFGYKVDNRVFFYLGSPMRMPMYDLTRIAIKSLAKIVKAMEDIAEGVPLSEALFMKDPWVFNRAKFSQLMFQQNHLYTGKPVEGKFPKAIWLKETDEVLLYFRNRLKLTSSLKQAYTDLSSMITTLEEARCNVIVTLSGGYRNAPFAVCLGKNPGIGKSNLIDFIAYEWCRVQGYNYTPDMVFHRDMTSEFWDGLSSQIVYHFSEIGTASKKIAETRGDEAAMELTSIIDSVMKSVNMADVKDKGKVKALPEIVIADTNNFSMNYQHMTCNFAAFMRRFLFIEAVVIEKYRLPGSCQIDYSKCNDGTHALNRWEFRVWREAAIDPQRTKQILLGEKLDIFQLSTLLRAQFADHLASQKFVEELRQDNKLFRLDPEEKDFPETNPLVAAASPVGKRLVGTFLERANEYAKYSAEKFDELKTRVESHFGTTLAEEKQWDGYQLQGDELLSDSFAESEVTEFDAAYQEEVKHASAEMKTVALPMRRLSLMSDEDKADMEFDMKKSMYVRICGRKYLYYMPIKTAYSLRVDQIQQYVQSRVHCPVIIGCGATFLIDNSKTEFRDANDFEIIASPEMLSVEQFDADPVRSHSFTQWLMFFFGNFYFIGGLFWHLLLMILHIPALFFAEFGVTGKFLQYIVAVALPAINLNFILVSSWFLCSFFYQMIVGPYDPIDSLRKKLNSLLLRFGLGRYNITSFQMKVMLGFVGLFTGAMLYWRKAGGADDEDDTPSREIVEDHGFKKVTQGNIVEVKEIEEKLDAGKSYKRMDSSRNKEIWVNYVDHSNPSPHTDSLESLGALAMKNLRKAKITVPGVRASYGYALGISNNCFIMPGHYFHDVTEACTVELWSQSKGVAAGGSHTVKLRKEDMVETGVDQVVFRVTDMPVHNILPHISEGPGAQVGKGFFRNAEVKCIYSSKTMIIDIADCNKSYKLPEYYMVSAPTSAGDCGLPLVFERDQGKSIVGMHVAGSMGSAEDNIGYSNVFYKSRIERAIEILYNGVSQSLNEPLEPTIVGDGFIPLSILEEPIPKSSFRYEELENLELHGKLPGKVLVRNKSSIKKSKLHDCGLDEVFNKTFGWYPVVHFIPPIMEPKWVGGEYLNPWSLNLIKANKKKKVLDRRIMRRSVHYILNHLVREMSKLKVPKLQPLELDVAINGVVEDEFIRRINASTAAGFGLKGKKRDHMPKVENEKRELAEHLQFQMVAIFEAFEKGEYVHFVYVASLKDEPREISKVHKGKTRVFFMSPLLELVIMRMLLSPFYTLMVQHSRVFGACIGMNPHREFGELFKELSDFSGLWMEGDFGGFDMSMPPDIGQGVNDIVYGFLKEFGYNAYSLCMVQGILAENLNVYVCMNLDLYSSFGLQPSGKFATAEDNSLRNLLGMVYAFFEMSEAKGLNLDFFSCVCPKVYGDDLLAAVKPEISTWYNNNTFSEFVDRVFGMEYTNTQKTKEMDDFINPAQSSFLKRNFEFHEALGRIVGKLDYNSIYKSLIWTEPSVSVPEAEQLIMTIDSALRESFFHLTEEKYDVLRKFLLAQFESHYSLSAKLCKTHFHTYEELVEFYASVKSSPKDSDVPVFPHEIVTEASNRICEVSGIQTDYRIFAECSFSRLSLEEKKEWLSKKDLEQLISDLQTEQKLLDEEDFRSPFPDFRIEDMKRLTEYNSSQEIRDSVDNYIVGYHKRKEVHDTLNFATSALARHSSNARFVAEMMTGLPHEGTVDSALTEKHENVVDVGGEESKENDCLTFSAPNKRTMVPMGNFLSRPILVGTYTVALSTPYSSILNVFDLFFADPSIRAKLRNFAFLRGKLKLRLSISASPFHYGKFYVCYVPQALNNDIFNFYAGAAAAYRNSFLVWMSQLEISHIMDVGDNMPLDFEIPYINFQHNVRLFNAATTSISGAFNDVTNLGKLLIYSINDIKSANSTAPTSLSMALYAYMDDAEIVGATGTQVSITTEGKNELVQGVVEKTASAMANASGSLTTVPFISPYAMASEKVFMSIAYLASLFGWSAPMVSPSTSKPGHIKNDAYQNAVETITYNMGKKLTFDPLQEIMVDPRVCGAEVDQLAFSFLCAKESLLAQFTWNETDVAFATLLYSAFVHPLMSFLGPTAAGQAFIQPTALAYCATPFVFWRGKIEFKFVIVCSQLHRGKLAVIFDPNVAQYTIITTTLHMNKQYMTIVDIQETTEFSVCVDWNFPKQWARLSDDVHANRSSGANFAAASAVNMVDVANGFITVFPYNALQCPDSTSTVQVNVFVKSTDMQFNVFDPYRMPFTRATTQSMNTTEYPSTCFELAEPNLDTRNMSQFHFW